jgi:hypothetical protein
MCFVAQCPGHGARRSGAATGQGKRPGGNRASTDSVKFAGAPAATMMLIQVALRCTGARPAITPGGCVKAFRPLFTLTNCLLNKFAERLASLV